jgi:hypothetical protein
MGRGDQNLFQPRHKIILGDLNDLGLQIISRDTASHKHGHPRLRARIFQMSNSASQIIDVGDAKSDDVILLHQT